MRTTGSPSDHVRLIKLFLFDTNFAEYPTGELHEREEGFRNK